MKTVLVSLSFLVLLLPACNIEGTEIDPTGANTGPLIIMEGNKNDTAYLFAGYSDPGAYVLDSEGHMPDSKDYHFVTNVTGTVNTRLPGTYYLVYNANDTLGNPLPTVTRTVQVVENKVAFLYGYYNVTCTCSAILQGSASPTITTGTYTAFVEPSQVNNDFKLSRLNVGFDFIAPFQSASLNGSSITLDFYHRNVVPGSTIISGTLSDTKNTFTIESTVYIFSPAIRYNCKNVYEKRLITK